MILCGLPPRGGTAPPAVIVASPSRLTIDTTLSREGTSSKTSARRLRSGGTARWSPFSMMLPKAITVVSEHMHSLFAVEPWIVRADKSKESCILCSLTVRDFLHEIGFTDATVRSVATYVDAQHNGERLSRLIIGHPEDDRPVKTTRWRGYMVCVVPSHNMLIDTTLYQAQRPAWPELPGTVAVPLIDFSDRPRRWPFVWCGLQAISAVVMQREDHFARVIWFDRPMNSWRHEADARNTSRRSNVVRQLVRLY